MSRHRENSHTSIGLTNYIETLSIEDLSALLIVYFANKNRLGATQAAACPLAIAFGVFIDY